MILKRVWVRGPSEYWKTPYTIVAFSFRESLLSQKSNHRLSLKCPVLNSWRKMECLSVWYWSKNKNSPEPGITLEGCVLELTAHLFLGQQHHSVTSKKDPFPWCFCLCHSGWWETGQSAPEACSLQSSAPYLCVSCFPPSVSNGRSWFPSSAVSSECFTTSGAQPSGKREASAISSDSCSMEHVFKINFILPSKLWPLKCTHLICWERQSWQNWDVGKRILWDRRVGTWELSLVTPGIQEVVGEVVFDFCLLHVSSHGCCGGLNTVLQIFISTWNLRM